MLQRGWRVSLITARPHPIDGVEQHVLKPVRHSMDWLFRVRAIRRLVADLQPDVIHAHYITSYGFLAACCGHRLVLMTAWGSDLLVTPQRNWLMRRLTTWTLGQARVVTGDSFSLLDAAQQFVPNVKTLLIHWGVDLSRFSPAPWSEKPGFQAVSLRSWEPNYCIDSIIDAMALVRTCMPDVPLTLHLLGGGPQEGMLRSQVAALGLDDYVRFHGKLDDAGMAAIFDSCKLSISVPESDATSVSVLESMASGLAVIASNLPANRQWLDERALVPAGQPEALARAWMGLMSRESLAKELASANAERMQSEGDRARQMDKVDLLYRELLQLV